MSKELGLSKEKIKNISLINKEPKWMREFRLNAYDAFKEIPNPHFGPELKIDFEQINYYKSVSSEPENNHINCNIENTGSFKVEDKYLDSFGVQYKGEVTCHNMIKELKEKNVIFCRIDEALQKYPELFKRYFNKLVKYDENKYTALNSAVWRGGIFIYVPPHTTIDRPLQSWLLINNKNIEQFERTLIIVDEDSHINYMEDYMTPYHLESSLHSAVVEVFVCKNASVRYTTIQNWKDNVYNLVTKRAEVLEGGSMEWIDGNIGAKVNMKYPTCILKGERAKGICISIAMASTNQMQDTGAKMIHLAPNTESEIISKSIALSGGEASYRGTVYIDFCAKNAKSKVKCDTIILDDKSKSDTIPKNIVNNNSSYLDHRATVTRLAQDKLFYLMSRGLDE